MARATQESPVVTAPLLQACAALGLGGRLEWELGGPAGASSFGMAAGEVAKSG